MSFVHVVHQQFKESLKRIKGSICIVKGVHSESSDEETELEPSRSKKRKAVIVRKTFIVYTPKMHLFISERTNFH